MNTPQKDTRSESVFIGVTFVLVLLAIPGLIGIFFVLLHVPPFLLMLATLIVPCMVIVNAVLKGRQAIFSIGFSVFFVLSTSQAIELLSGRDLPEQVVAINLACLALSCIFGGICKAIFGKKRSDQIPKVGQSPTSSV